MMMMAALTFIIDGGFMIVDGWVMMIIMSRLGNVRPGCALFDDLCFLG